MRCQLDEKRQHIPVSTGGGADIRIEGLSWRPLRRRTPVLNQLELSIAAGERILLAGPSGAGKSTLLRALAGVLSTSSAGEITGRVAHGGKPRVSVGYLQQEPLAGVVAETVGRDVAFGLENRGVAREEIRPQVVDVLSAIRFPYGLQHPVAALSGGELQRLMLAGALVLKTPVLLLDEPTSMLDPEAAESVRELLRAVVATTGCTLVVVDHELQPWLDFVDRLVLLGPDGRIVADGPPANVVANSTRSLEDSGVWLPNAGPPSLVDVDSVLVQPYVECPTDLVFVDSVVVDLRQRLADRPSEPRRALDGVSTTLRSGRVLALTGPSGAGKSTLAAVLAGLQRPTTGTVYAASTLATRRGDQPWRWRSVDLASRLAWAPQFPEHGIVATTVSEEILATARACGRDTDGIRSRAAALLETLSLSALADVSPYQLSGGEQRRLMVAAALAHGPCGVIFDEPTVGQDRHTWATVLGAVRAACAAGVAVAMSTHDENAAAALATDRVRLNLGRVVA